MAAYGLYTHIQSNKRRSIALLIGLFLLVYVLVYAGALAAEAMSYDASVEWYLRRAWQDFLPAAPIATIGTEWCGPPLRRISPVAASPSISGMCTSIRTMS